MNFFLLLMSMMSLKVVLSDNAKNLFCFHTQYFLNFFNHNERFLLEIEKNEDYITIENLTNYGKALQTHDRICNTEAHSEIYSFITKHSNKTDIDYYKDVEYVDDNITEFSLENLNFDQNENYINTNDFTVNQSTHNPHYMIDYLPYDV
ncbi:uncharacterized protein LOC126902293 isoform X2 [Daktulosphaira vitifoliae]|uniref:uncharacterized protein LOC126902293 isoform X2 n=1 Tax=Daktulosphaira vitifoliae TaxID=58002 RepID=UPI0021AA7C67|nr:uncharacterized protein LOC126902293 isoform X2 [Daktulosphaira vitifoliae]